MNILSKFFLSKHKKEKTEEKLSVEDMQQEVLDYLQAKVHEHKRYENSGSYTSNCLYFDVSEAKDYNDRINLLHKNQKDVGNYFDSMFHFTNCKDGFLTCDNGYGCHRDALFSEYFNDLCTLTFKKLKQYGVEYAKIEIEQHAEWMKSCVGVLVKEEYIALKQREAELRYERMLFLEQEKEQKREERIAQLEYKEAILKAEKEEKRISKVLETEKSRYANTVSKQDLDILQKRIAQLEAELQEAHEIHQRALSMAQQTRAGYVYIISNIGSFGENIYKIGLTRRINPMDRIDELSNASVPFPFDVHAFIYSDDAPALEAKFHQALHKHRVNAINYRKEYFRVTLNEIKEVANKIGLELHIIEQPYATEYSDSLKLHSFPSHNEYHEKRIKK